MMKLVKHLTLITRHKIIVMKLCFKCGMYKQGVLHDISKYSFVELKCGMVYFNGKISPNAMERSVNGYSESWLHHKGRNKHHYEYWIDFSDDGIKLISIPNKYIVEMFLDRIAATMIYQGKDFSNRSPLEYYNKTKDNMMINEQSKFKLEQMLLYLSEHTLMETLDFVKIEYIKKS